MALWTVVIPVKALPGAKTRLAGDVATPADLAVAFLRDTLTAVLATPEVVRTVVVTCDATVWALALEAGATVVDDSAHPGINPAARHGAEERAPGSGLAVLVSDLPCLTPGALTTALSAAEPHAHAFLPDLDGLGTTMWFAAAGAVVEPRFGVGSRAAHARAGAVDLVDANPDLVDRLTPARLDIDTVDALDRAVRLGLGAATAAALTALHS